MLKLTIVRATEDLNDSRMSLTKGKKYYVRRSRRGNALFLLDDRNRWVLYRHNHYYFGYAFPDLENIVVPQDNLYFKNRRSLNSFVSSGNIVEEGEG